MDVINLLKHFSRPSLEFYNVVPHDHVCEMSASQINIFLQNQYSEKLLSYVRRFRERDLKSVFSNVYFMWGFFPEACLLRYCIFVMQIRHNICEAVWEKRRIDAN